MPVYSIPGVPPATAKRNPSPKGNITCQAFRMSYTSILPTPALSLLSNFAIKSYRPTYKLPGGPNNVLLYCLLRYQYPGVKPSCQCPSPHCSQAQHLALGAEGSSTPICSHNHAITSNPQLQSSNDAARR